MLQIKNTLGGGKPEGMYVWKKYEGIPPVSNITLKFEMITYGNPCVVKVSSDDIDLSLVDSTIFIGMTLSGTLTASSSATSFAFVSENEFTKNSATYSYNYDPSSQTITMNYEFTATVIWNNSVVSYSGNLSFLNYIVSDKETAYPDGGEKGGYWYEKVGDGLTPEMFGCTKYEVGSFTLSSDNYTVSFNHTLGEKPKAVIINENSSITDSNYVNTYLAPSSYGAYVYSNRVSGNSASGNTLNESTVTVTTGNTSRKFKSGVKYNYVLLA